MKTRIGITSVLRRYYVGLSVGAAGLLLLAACDAGLPALPDEIPFRNPTVTIAGTVRFDPGRFAGEWFIVARFADDVDTRRVYLFDPLSGVMQEREGEEQRDYRVTAPGVLEQISPPSGEVLVVMWVDDGFRTAVVGTASGSRGVILDRRPGSAPDRLTAAREILDFNGWDTSRLQEVTE